MWWDCDDVYDFLPKNDPNWEKLGTQQSVIVQQATGHTDVRLCGCGCQGWSLHRGWNYFQPIYCSMQRIRSKNKQPIAVYFKFTHAFVRLSFFEHFLNRHKTNIVFDEFKWYSLINGGRCLHMKILKFKRGNTETGEAIIWNNSFHFVCCDDELGRFANDDRTFRNSHWKSPTIYCFEWVVNGVINGWPWILSQFINKHIQCFVWFDQWNRYREPQ